METQSLERPKNHWPMAIPYPSPAPIRRALSDHDVVSPIVMRMIVVGEETGKLDSCLEKVSTRMDDEIPRRIKRLFGILEPMIILTLLGIVGMIAAAIFLPLFSLMSGIRR